MVQLWPQQRRLTSLPDEQAYTAAMATVDNLNTVGVIFAPALLMFLAGVYVEDGFDARARAAAWRSKSRKRTMTSSPALQCLERMTRLRSTSPLATWRAVNPPCLSPSPRVVMRLLTHAKLATV